MDPIPLTEELFKKLDHTANAILMIDKIRDRTGKAA